MKRLVWGIVLAVFGLLCLLSASQNQQGPTGSIVFGILCLGGGGTLIFLAVHYFRDREAVAESALAMLRDGGKIDSRALASKIGLRELRARELLAELQRRNILPIQADVV